MFENKYQLDNEDTQTLEVCPCEEKCLGICLDDRI
jgi:hypothetical protein